jgi:Transposase IS116/IS110/IS902 family
VLAPHAETIELLCTIPGVQTHAAQVLIAECGLDMTVFPTVGHFASWAGACPGHHQSAGRRRSGRTRPGPSWLTAQLTECARAAARAKGTYLAAHFAQLRGRRGEPKAIGALRHDLLVAYYHIVRDQVPFRELGPDWQRKRYSPEHRGPPTPTPTRSARLHRHARPSRTTRSRTSRLNQETSQPRLPPTQRRRERPCPNASSRRGFTGQPRRRPGLRRRPCRVLRSCCPGYPRLRWLRPGDLPGVFDALRHRERVLGLVPSRACRSRPRHGRYPGRSSSRPRARAESRARSAPWKNGRAVVRTRSAAKAQRTLPSPRAFSSNGKRPRSSGVTPSQGRTQAFAAGGTARVLARWLHPSVWQAFTSAKGPEQQTSG